MATIAVIVDWAGPFGTIEAAKEAAAGMGDVLYLAVGQRRYQRQTSMQYVGISSNPQSRISKHHHKLPEVSKNFGLWIGQVSSHAVAGRSAGGKAPKHPKALGLAEWSTAYFLALHLNEKKRAKPPKSPVLLVNRWFGTDFVTRRTHRGHKDWPDLIEYEPGEGFARIQHFGAQGKGKRLSEAQIANLAL